MKLIHLFSGNRRGEWQHISNMSSRLAAISLLVPLLGSDWIFPSETSWTESSSWCSAWTGYVAYSSRCYCSLFIWQSYLINILLSKMSYLKSLKTCNFCRKPQKNTMAVPVGIHVYLYPASFGCKNNLFLCCCCCSFVQPFVYVTRTRWRPWNHKPLWIRVLAELRAWERGDFIARFVHTC